MQGFNPTMVRLLLVGFRAASGRLVSIPQWCDCCAEPGIENPEQVASFNPTMVRLLLAKWGVGVAIYAGFNPTMVRLLLIIWFSYLQLRV